MDKINITDLEVYCHHGVFKEENTLGQKFLVCVSLHFKMTDGKPDDVANTINYKDVCEDISDFMKSHTFKLIETVANKLALFLLKKHTLAMTAEVEIKKPWAPIGMPLKYVSAYCLRKRHTAYIALGSNIGDSKKTFDNALDAINSVEGCLVKSVSEFVVYKPYGKTDQPDFLNGCAKISTVLSPQEFLSVLQQIETSFGRVRTQKWAARTLDLDLLFYDNEIINSESLTVPHYDIQNREFVLGPLCEIAPHYVHPILGKSIKNLHQQLTKK